MIRLLVCDDSVEARTMLRMALADGREFEVVGEAADGAEAIAQAVELTPDVVLMDVSMPVMDGIEATGRIKELVPSTRVVALAGSADLAIVEAMLDAGASAYCIKGAPLWQLERAIAGAGQPLVRLAHALGRALPGGVGQLVARELAELTGALCAATYLTSSEAGLSLAGLAGAPTRDRLSSAPGIVLRAFTEEASATADAHELAELYRLGVPCGDAFAVPLIGDGVRLGALFVAMPANVQHELDQEIVAATADLAAASLAQERRLALTYAEARRDALTGLPNRRAFDEHMDEPARKPRGRTRPARHRRVQGRQRHPRPRGRRRGPLRARARVPPHGAGQRAHLQDRRRRVRGRDRRRPRSGGQGGEANRPQRAGAAPRPRPADALRGSRVRARRTGEIARDVCAGGCRAVRGEGRRAERDRRLRRDNAAAVSGTSIGAGGRAGGATGDSAAPAPSR